MPIEGSTIKIAINGGVSKGILIGGSALHGLVSTFGGSLVFNATSVLVGKRVFMTLEIAAFKLVGKVILRDNWVFVSSFEEGWDDSGTFL
jgi:hypothetical protein